jgi:hypothetical protein
MTIDEKGVLLMRNAILSALLVTMLGVGVLAAGELEPTAPLLGGDTVDPHNDGSQYAWSENAGWLNAEPLGDGGACMRVLEGRAEGWIWSENVAWISLSRHNTGT